jgi:hypothetical protein
MISAEVLDHLCDKIAEAVQVVEASYDEKKLTRS